jgi:hypothetical protein
MSAPAPPKSDPALQTANKQVDDLLAALRRAQNSAEARELGTRLREAIRKVKALAA